METIHRIVFALSVGVTFFFCRGATAAEFALTEANWKPDNLVFYVEGKARQPDSVVLVRDAYTRALLGSAAVRADGKWVLKIRNPKSVPPRILAELGSKRVECAVEGAGSNQIIPDAEERAGGPAGGPADAHLSFSPQASGTKEALSIGTATAINEVSFEDAKKILNGGSTAATDYFKLKTSLNLFDAFKPEISSGMNEAEVTYIFQAITDKTSAWKKELGVFVGENRGAGIISFIEGKKEISPDHPD